MIKSLTLSLVLFVCFSLPAYADDNSGDQQFVIVTYVQIDTNSYLRIVDAQFLGYSLTILSDDSLILYETGHMNRMTYIYDYAVVGEPIMYNRAEIDTGTSGIVHKRTHVFIRYIYSVYIPVVSKL